MSRVIVHVTWAYEFEVDADEVKDVVVDLNEGYHWDLPKNINDGLNALEGADLVDLEAWAA
jgi:hypothetical protein